MSSPEEPNPRRIRWTWRVLAGATLVGVSVFALNVLFQTGNEVLALALLAAGLVAPGAWQLSRKRSRD